ncbi:MAG: hypothetical protein KJ597_02440 [Nanoarchaeota archaeon]|nr:hypothetical protein [Nanoarchaeota archaeon]MBU1622408.1 hypothetical protein [Nanoarchaeota archaeon]
MKKRGLLVWYLAIIVLVAVLIALYVIVNDQLYQNIFLALLIVVLILIALFLYYEFAHHPSVLRKKLYELEEELKEESLDFLKKKYMEVYHLYLKIPERKKSHFYPRVTAAHQLVEGQMKRHHKVEDLISRAEKATFMELCQVYTEFRKVFKELTSKSQQHYYHHYSYLKDKVERG